MLKILIHLITIHIASFVNTLALSSHLGQTTRIPPLRSSAINEQNKMWDSPEANPPNWPESVIILTPDQHAEQIYERIRHTEDEKSKFGYNSNRHFTDERYALLFAPGVYENLDFEVGYYVQLAGLGARADDVLFTNCNYGPHVEALNKGDGGNNGLSLDTFWRVAENFQSKTKNGMFWAVSQAAPLRRVHIVGDLMLHDKGAYASGGVLANAILEGGTVDFGSQQQWLCRSVDFKNQDLNSINVGAWSNVFVDCINSPMARDGSDDGPSITVDNAPPLVVEKPFVALKKAGILFELRVPPPRIRQPGEEKPFGPDLTGEDDDVRDFAGVKVGVANIVESKTGATTPDKDIATKLQASLDEGKDLVLAPGIFHLDKTLEVRRSNQVILGLGLATLVAPLDGSPCIRVMPGLEGVRIAGIMLEASNLIAKPKKTIASMLDWGKEGVKDDGNPSNPGALVDIFARVGGSNPDRKVSTDVMIRIFSGNVYGDNLWLWRADHVQLCEGEKANFPEISPHYYQTVEGDCPVKTGIEVYGDNVTIHGLAVEHTTEHQTVWKGNRGNVQFYQCEYPYDVTADFAEKKYMGYLVDDAVTHHIAGGVGVYSNFRDYTVPVSTAIQHSKVSDHVIITHPFTKMLNNNGKILTVINELGGPADDKTSPPTRYCAKALKKTSDGIK